MLLNIFLKKRTSILAIHWWDWILHLWLSTSGSCKHLFVPVSTGFWHLMSQNTFLSWHTLWPCTLVSGVRWVLSAAGSGVPGSHFYTETPSNNLQTSHLSKPKQCKLNSISPWLDLSPEWYKGKCDRGKLEQKETAIWPVIKIYYFCKIYKRVWPYEHIVGPIPGPWKGQCKWAASGWILLCIPGWCSKIVPAVFSLLGSHFRLTLTLCLTSRHSLHLLAPFDSSPCLGEFGIRSS